MANFSDDPRQEGPREKKNIDELRKEWARQDIKREVDKSRSKLDGLFDSEALEEKLKRQEEQRQKEREELSQRRKEKKPEQHNAGSLLSEVYAAKAAIAKSSDKKKTRKEGFLRRLIRFNKDLAIQKKMLRTKAFCTQEQKRKAFQKVFRDAMAPVSIFAFEAVETLWGFISDLGRDTWYIVLTIADVLVTIGYYIGSIGYFLWDVFWDIRYAMDQHKRKLFFWFSSILSIMAIALIAVSSLSAYEYSYYGKSLGLAKSKQDVYRTIDVLGDKLSYAMGANINLNVERDIEFKRVFGFNMDVDSADDILNTLTYMKDVQVQAYAITIDGEQVVVLENQETANQVLEQIKTDFAGPKTGVKYSIIRFEESVITEEVTIKLGDIWNPDDAVRYLETGTVEESEEEFIQAHIHVYSYETATYEEVIPYEYEYIDNTSIYEDETELISQGSDGLDLVVAEIERVNGEVVNKNVITSTRTTNPINALYYQGTKPIPERKGTGTFILPLKGTLTITSRFGNRNTGIVGATTYHEGVDFGEPTGTKIYAIDGGTVTFSGYKAGYGYCIFIDHGGLYESRYGHCSKLLVKQGDEVYQGQNIGLVGSTGVSSGPHLHLEIHYKGVAYDPLTFYPQLQ